jgi:two-component system, NtrC family, sensor kinase
VTAIVAGVLGLAAAAAGAALWRERRRRRDAERQVRELDARVEGGTTDRGWMAVLTHELRTPAGAILGYGELLADGTFGELPPAADDAVRRLRAAADQLVALLDGLDNGVAAITPVASTVGAGTLLEEAAAALRVDAEARTVTIQLVEGDVSFATDRGQASRALRLALGAAVKASAGAVLTVSAHDGAVPRVEIHGSRLDPVRDGPGGGATAGPVLTGAGLRLELARRAAACVGGDIRIIDDAGGAAVVQLTLPPLPIDGAEESP